VIARSHFVELKTLGYAAWMVPGYQKVITPAVVQSVAGYPSPSVHVGVVGEKITVSAKVLSVKELSSESYGTSWLHNMVDSHGNQLKWFCTSSKAKLAEGVTLTITGTIKEHKTYNGTAQTILSRVKPV
jgi:hypothetical protein